MVSKGTGASLGIAIAKAYLIIDPVFDVKNTTVSDVKEEVALYEKALVQTQRQIAKIQRIVHDKMGPDKADIFTAHIQIANDPEIKKEIIHTIQTSRLNSAYVVTQVFDRYYQTFASMEDNYFKERAGDIYDITKRILSNILHVPLPDILGIKEPCIVVANDLTPSAMALLEKQYVKGVVTNYGGRTSHAAIMARSMEIPAVVGLTDITKKITTGQLIAINGENGEVEIAPTDINKWQQRIKDFARLKEEFKKYINVPSVTLDGHKVEVEGNIGKPVDAPLAVNHGAEGIGLFRSEFLYMDNDHWPTEDEQYQGYKKVLETFKDKTVVIRTLDIGGDKKLSYFIFPDEANPFLG
jgi:phosphotransferase system enzyme I (PtsI)